MNRMKMIIGLTLIGGLIWVAPVKAAPDKNPQIVADYDTGTHAIAGEEVNRVGGDVVMRSGNSNNFQQWYYGPTITAGIGIHSVWLSVGDKTQCPNGWILVKEANKTWGDYLAEGNYCVHNNDNGSATPLK